MRKHITGSRVSNVVRGVVLLSLILQPLRARGEETANPTEIIFQCDFESKAWWQEWDQREPPKRTETVATDVKRNFEAHDGKALRIRVDQGGHYGVSMDYSFAKKTGSEPEEVYFRYYLRLADDWRPERMRDVDTLNIETIWINVYHGGTWTATADHHLYIDDVVISRSRIGQ